MLFSVIVIIRLLMVIGELFPIIPVSGVRSAILFGEQKHDTFFNYKTNNLHKGQEMKELTRDRRIVYVAGAYSADDVMTVFDNMKTGIALGAKLVSCGASVICPFLDYNFLLQEGFNIPKERIMQSNLDLSGLVHAIVLTDNEKNTSSPGTFVEVVRANKRGTPVFTNFASYLEWATVEGSYVMTYTSSWLTGVVNLAVVKFPQQEMSLGEK